MDFMELKEIKCANCQREILVIEEYARDKMFCTLGCMDSYKIPCELHFSKI